MRILWDEASDDLPSFPRIMALRPKPETLPDAENLQVIRLSRHLKVARWLRRGGYLALLVFVIWLLIYTARGANFHQAGSDRQAAEWLAWGRSVSTVLIRIALGLIGVGILIPVVERVRYSKLK